jgi:hypothetical protein
MNTKLSKSTIDKLVKVILKSVPIIPASELYALFSEIKKSENSIEAKINKAYESLTETSNLLTELQSELTERTMQVSKLSEEYERYSKLAEIEEEKVKPLLIQLDQAVNKGKYQERWIAFIINIITGIVIFALGIWLGPKITTLINHK